MEQICGRQPSKVGVLKYLVQEADFRPTDKQIEDFLIRVEDLVKPIPAGATKPISFTFHVRGKVPVIRPVKSGFNSLVMGVCLLMREGHPNTFRKTLLAMPEWFSESEENFKSARKIQGIEPTIWLKHCTAHESREVCKLVVTKFGYLPESLTIEEK